MGFFYVRYVRKDSAPVILRGFYDHYIEYVCGTTKDKSIAYNADLHDKMIKILESAGYEAEYLASEGYDENYIPSCEGCGH